jgi:diacylglycerol O-acyltransferase
MADSPSPTSKLSHRLTAQDSTFLYGESNSGPLHIGSISFFEKVVTIEELRHQVASRLHLLSRYRQRLAFVPFNLANPTLEDDPDFHIDNHLRHHKLPSGTPLADFVKAAMRIYEPPLDRKRPLWEMHLFDGFEGGGSAIVWKIHHCLVDGVSGMELLTVVLDLAPDAPEPPPPAEPWNPKPLPTFFKSLVDGVFDLASQQLAQMRRSGAVLADISSLPNRLTPLASSATAMGRLFSRQVVSTPWNVVPVSQERSLDWVKCSFGDLRAVRSAVGGTINDVVLTILTEGAARYLKHHKVNAEGRSMRIGCPVSVRRERESGSLGNRVSMMFPEMPATPMKPSERLKLIADETARIKGAAEPQALESLMGAADSIPPAFVSTAASVALSAMEGLGTVMRAMPLMSRIFSMPAPGFNFIATNVPGPQVPVYLNGHRMVDYVGLVPLGGNLGYGVAIVSYNQNLYFGLMAEPHLMPDVHLMRKYIEEAFAELRAAVQAPAQVVVQPAARGFRKRMPAKPAPIPAPALPVNGQPAARPV